jgi:hypothetical protein
MEGTVPKGLAVSTFREGMFLPFLNGFSIDYMQFLGSSQFKFKKKKGPSQIEMGLSAKEDILRPLKKSFELFDYTDLRTLILSAKSIGNLCHQRFLSFFRNLILTV